MTYIIGLTGSIACGKSTVANMVGELGATVIDADILAHQVMLPGTEVFQALVSRFSTRILGADGAIDRRAMGEIVFNDKRALEELENLTHPRVAEMAAEIARTSGKQVCIIEAVKLLESSVRTFCDAVWLVTCTYARQVERLRERNFTEDQIRARLGAQPPLYLRLMAAHVVIENSGPITTTRMQVQTAWSNLPI